MALDREIDDLENFLSEATREELVDYILSKEKEDKKALEKKEIIQEESFPATIFSLELSPLEAASRYLKDIKKKSINKIAKILSKHPSAISTAYKNSKEKNFDFKQSEIQIPLSIFSENKELSISEATSIFLIEKGMKIVQISFVLNKDQRTVWTFVDRAKKKLKGVNKNEI